MAQQIEWKETELHVWSERDRQHIELRAEASQETILEFWDEEVTEAYEDGFLSARCHGEPHRFCNLHKQMYELAQERGLLERKVQNG